MKEFVKTMLAVICGFVVLRILRILLFLVFLGSALMSGTSTLPRQGVLDLDMSAFTLTEQSQEVPFPSTAGLMSFDMLPVVGMHDAVSALRTAASDPGVK